MRLPLKLTKAFFVALVFVLLFVLVALWVSDQKIQQFDSSIIRVVQGQESPVLTSVMKGFTFVGSVGMSIVLSALVLLLLYFLYRRRAELLFFFAVMAGSAVLNQVLKFAFHRQRPNIHRLVQVTGYSFPSGHSMAAFAMYGALAFLLWRHLRTRFLRGLLILFAVLMIFGIGISRIYLGVHYPSDVLGGFLASGFWLLLAVWYFQQQMEQHYEARRR